MKVIKLVLGLAALLGIIVLSFEITHRIAPHLPFFGQGDAKVATKTRSTAPVQTADSRVTVSEPSADLVQDISHQTSTTSAVPSEDISEHQRPPVAASEPLLPTGTTTRVAASEPPTETASSQPAVPYGEPSPQSHGHHSSSAHSSSSSQNHIRMQVHPSVDERYRAFARTTVERERFERHTGPIRFVPAHRAVLTHIRIVPSTYYYRREAFYDTYAWQPPSYVYRLDPRYGLFDATFLAFALDHTSDEQYAAMFYNHQNEPEIQQWMSDAGHLAADNSELRRKLAVMKAKMSALEESGVGSDPSFVPPDAQDVVLSPEVIAQLTAASGKAHQ
jgi:hypothetical protein